MKSLRSRHVHAQVEPLEQRIAPATLTNIQPINLGSPTLLDADPSTPFAAGISAGLDGPVLLYVTKGSCLVYSNDLNGNHTVDFNEITGIAAGDGLRLISFVDIHGDIVTNLRTDGTLTDSDNNASNGRDGQVLLNNKIESITLRTVTASDFPTGTDLFDRVALTSYSIFGNIYAGGGFGTTDGGLTIDNSNESLVSTRFSAGVLSLYTKTKPQIGSIRVGSAASGQYFAYGTSAADDPAGVIQPFTPAANAPGADIINIRALNPATKFNFNTLQAGDGGFNGRGGDVINVIASGDTAGGYDLIAGNAGPGPTGPRGGNVQDWVDLGSITSEVFIKTGNGGQGLFGKGGNGGSLTFGNAPAIDTDGDPATPPVVPATATTLGARLKITLGDGGDGLTGGGNGGSMPSGIFLTPETEIPSPLEIVSTWHRPGDIGVTISVADDGSVLSSSDANYHALRGFDFDGDGANDIVYTSTQSNGQQSSQVVVLFGATDETGAATGDIDQTRTMFLDSPDNPDAITIGDFNNDGKPDIAVASGSYSMGGVMVILSNYDAVTGEFVGFRDSIYSSMPSVGGTTAFDGASVTLFGSQILAYKIFEMASGDFDGDGVVDLGVMTEKGMFLLHGDKDLGPNGTTAVGNGHFFADVAANFNFIPAAGDLVGTFPVIKASALQDGGSKVDPADEDEPARDTLFACAIGDPSSSVSAFDFSLGSLFRSSVSLGVVDTNRGNDNAPASAAAADFTFLDIDADGIAEMSTLTASPQGFLVNFTSSTPDPTNPFDTIISGTGNNAGIRLGLDGLGFPSVNGLVGILTTHGLGEAAANNVMVVDYTSPTPVTALGLSFGPINAQGLAPVTIAGPDFSPIVYTGDNSVRAFDVYIPAPDMGDFTSLVIAPPQKDDRLKDFVSGQFFLNGDAPLERNGYFIEAGDGGSSSNGKGGLGGKLGSSLSYDLATGTFLGALDIILPGQLAYEPTVRLIAGTGGDGFRDGGNGGTIEGVSVRGEIRTAVTLLLAGDGGNSIKGKGGNGGDLKSFFAWEGQIFSSGDGGNGVVGGNAGSVLGNPQNLHDTQAGNSTDFANTISDEVLVIAGKGGSGIKAGGNGGNVTGFTPLFLPTVGSSYYVRAGDAGNATIGKGGIGGNITDAGPADAASHPGAITLYANQFNGDIAFFGGLGGNGVNGGRGGNISNFTNVNTGDLTPFSTIFRAGNGGIATAGTGGAGGAVSGIKVSGTGIGELPFLDLSKPDELETIDDATIGVDNVFFSRIVAGAGGNSLGGTGGAGGAVTNVDVTAQSSTFAIAAGSGGDGLLKGGAGGSVMSASANSGAQTAIVRIPIGQQFFVVNKAQVLVIAGEGGDAFSSIFSSTDPLAPGRIAPKGGNGGSIIDFTQSSSTDVNFQFIAGNGGNTPNAGSATDVKNKVGAGGSIKNIAVAGNIGDTGDPTDGDVLDPLAEPEEQTGAPIRSYNPLFDSDPSNDRMRDFVQTRLIEDLTTPSANGLGLGLVNGDTGNVGFVVGAKGRIQDLNNDGKLDAAPDFTGTVPNGSLMNVQARNILSAVADNVDRIASIQVLKNIKTYIVGGEYGADRQEDSSGGLSSPADSVPYTLGSGASSLDYLTATGFHSSVPVIGGRLVDGAIVAKTPRVPLSGRDFKLG